MDYQALYEKTPPTKLLAYVAIPGIISMFVSSLYQIIDGALVGKILGSAAFAALNLVMPLVSINFSIADLIGVGSAVPIAIKLGQKDEKSASVIFSSACLMIVFSGAILGAVLFLSAEPLVRFMGANEEIVKMSSQYLKVYAVCSPFVTIMFAVDNYLRICGKVRFSLLLNVLMSVISAVLEIIFLVVFRMGVAGASLSTCIAMIICVILGFLPFIRGKLQLRFVKPEFDRKMMLNIIKNGTPTFLDNIAGRVTSIIMNVFLLRMGGPTAVAAYGVLMYGESLVLPMLYGLCDSLQPAIGYNYGMKNYKRIYAIERRCFGICAVISIIMTSVLFFARGTIVSIFVKADDIELITMSVHALSLFAFTFVTRWIPLATQSYLSAVGKAGHATIIAVSLSLVAPIIVLIAFRGFGLNGLWLNMPMTCLIVSVLSVILLNITYRKEAV
jgi:putative MATE family efflux protein